MVLIDRFQTDVPPGFEGHPIAFAATLFSLLTINLLALEWLWRLTWGIVEDRCPLKHPTTVLRVVLIGLVAGAVIRSGPDLLWLMFWNDTTDVQRQWLLQLDSLMDSVAFIPWVISWLMAYLGMPMLQYQLKIHPLPIHLWPTPRQIMRPLKIFFGVLFITLVITYHR